MIEVRGCSKTYPGRDGRPGTPALDRIDLTIREHEFVSLFGPSGCGKTTLLKILAGLVSWDSGSVLIDGHPVAGPGPDRAMVFQDFALLPWADVVTNVAFGLEVRGMPADERRRRALERIRAVGLAGFERHCPRDLSGGMQQRVGLARALAVNPSILLMDEPFSSVDAQTRRQLQEDLQRLCQREPKTVVFVTHGMDEAVNMGDRVIVFSPRPGRVVESIEVPLPRPRVGEVRKHKLYVELKEYLWSRIRELNEAAAREGGGNA
jgi:NitT/TauT family transport system ATP-binding protein